MPDLQLSLLSGVEPREHPGDSPPWHEKALYVAACYAHEQGAVTADDLRRLIPDPPSLNMIGALFRDAKRERLFLALGRIESKRPVANERSIQRWALTDKGRRVLLGI